MTDLRQAAQQALDAYESTNLDMHIAAIHALRTALAQQTEPIGWLDGNDKLAEFMHRDLKAEHDKRGSATPREFTVPVYTTTPQRKPLTDAEFCEQWLKQTGRIMGTDKQLLLQAKQVTEVAHGIKANT